MCRVSNSLLGSAERDAAHPSACAMDAAWGLVTADAGMKPASLLILTLNVTLML